MCRSEAASSSSSLPSFLLAFAAFARRACCQSPPRRPSAITSALSQRAGVAQFHCRHGCRGAPFIRVLHYFAAYLCRARSVASGPATIRAMMPPALRVTRRPLRGVARHARSVKPTVVCGAAALQLFEGLYYGARVSQHAYAKSRSREVERDLRYAHGYVVVAAAPEELLCYARRSECAAHTLREVRVAASPVPSSCPFLFSAQRVTRRHASMSIHLPAYTAQPSMMICCLWRLLRQARRQQCARFIRAAVVCVRRRQRRMKRRAHFRWAGMGAGRNPPNQVGRWVVGAGEAGRNWGQDLKRRAAGRANQAVVMLGGRQVVAGREGGGPAWSENPAVRSFNLVLPIRNRVVGLWKAPSLAWLPWASLVQRYVCPPPHEGYK